MRGRALTSPEGPGAARRLFIVLAAATALCLSRRLRGRGGREGGRTARPSEQSPSASGGAGAEVGGSERAEAPPGGR